MYHTILLYVSFGGWHETAKGKKMALGKLAGGKYSGLMLSHSLSLTRPSVPVTAALAALPDYILDSILPTGEYFNRFRACGIEKKNVISGRTFGSRLGYASHDQGTIL